MRPPFIQALMLALSLIFPLTGIAQDNAYDYLNRGIAKLTECDLDGAVSDYSRAIQLDPGCTSAYLGRGSAKQAMGDLDAALADYNRALRAYPKDADAFERLGTLCYIKRDWAEAVRDFRRYCDLVSSEEDYPRIFIWLIQTRQGESTAANKELADYLEKQKTAGQATWASNVAEYLLGKMTEADLLATTKSPDASTEQGQLCEFWYYIGMNKLLTGSKAGAGIYFRKCLATNFKNYNEYQFAEAELKALEP